MKLGSFPALLLLLVPSSLARAQQPPCLERTIAVSLTRGDGTPVTSVDSLAFRGVYGNGAVTIRSIKPAERLPRVILLIDTSGSMALSEPAAAVLAERFVSRLPADTEIGLAFFASNYILMAPLSKDRSKLTFALEALKNGQYYSEGLTALWAAVGEAAKMFGSPSLGETIYVISDGGDNRSKSNVQAEEQALTGSGIRLFAAVFTGPLGLRMRSIEELNGPGIIKEAARVTGGALLFDPEAPGGYYSELDMVGKNGKPTRFAEDLNRQLDQILNYYRFEITIPKPVRKPQSWRLQISNAGEAPAERVLLSYPILLMPCQ